ncbi:MAG: tetratricopeptide repeat protein [Acidobacteriota bacterium]|nr:tetratricopeptide repeat protein [Acidobacteriota bacterium]
MHHLVLDLTAASPVTARLTGITDAWTCEDLHQGEELTVLLRALPEYIFHPVPTDEHGRPIPAKQGFLKEQEEHMRQVGAVLAKSAFNASAQDRLTKTIQDAKQGEPPLLTIRVHPAGKTDEDLARADALLTLPWELLFLDETFPVREGLLDLVRDAAPGRTPLPPSDAPLSVLACVAAPVDQGSVDFETENFRLWHALTHHGHESRLLQTDLGTLEDLTRMMHYHKAPVLHFSGHGLPGALVFETDAATTHQVPTGDLLQRLRPHLPRLIYLSSCHGGTAETAAGGNRYRPDHDPVPATAAALQREGIEGVAAYLGPVGDSLATLTSAIFYAALAEGASPRTALREARRITRAPVLDGGRKSHIYPLGWAQIQLYHGSPDTPPARPLDGRPLPNLEQRECQRVQDRLDRQGGIRGVQRLRFGFVGRRKPRADLIRRWREGTRLAVVYGLGGLGKTALCTECLPHLAAAMGEAIPILALDGRGAGAEPHPVEALWHQTAQTGSELAPDPQAWQQVLAGAQEGGVTGAALAALIEQLCRLCNGLLVYLDDAESLQDPQDPGRWHSDEIAQFWQALAAAAGHLAPLGLLASSRYVPQDLAQAHTLALPVMREADTVRLLRWFPTLRRLDGERRMALAEKVDGHPRTLEFLEGYAAQRLPDGDTPPQRLWAEVVQPVLAKTAEKVNADLALEALWAALSEPDQVLLADCALPGEANPWPALLELGEAENADRLRRTGLLSPVQAPVGTETWWGPHRLVADFALQRAEPDADRVFAALGAWFRDRWQREDDLYSADHAASLLLKAGRADDAWAPTQEVILELRRMGRYHEALQRVEAVLAAEPTGPERGKTLLFRVQLLGNIGKRPDEAEAWLREGIDLVEDSDKSFGYDELGEYFSARGNLTDAAQALQQSVGIEIELKGEQDVSVAASLHSLAGVLKAQGDLPGAREHLQRSLAIWEQVFGTDLHPSVAASLHSLAGVLKAQGDLPGAREHLQRSLAISEQVFGTDLHPDVAASLHELARVLQAQGDLPAAREHLQRSLAIYEQVFGTDRHPHVAAALHELAGVLQAQGDLELAKETFTRVLAIKEEIFKGLDHYSTALTEHNLGQLLLQTGEAEEGLKLIRKAFKTFQKKLGPQHPYTQQLGQFLASWSDKPEEAES